MLKSKINNVFKDKLFSSEPSKIFISLIFISIKYSNKYSYLTKLYERNKYIIQFKNKHDFIIKIKVDVVVEINNFSLESIQIEKKYIKLRKLFLGAVFEFLKMH